MNFLAHVFLSCTDEELMIGNFIADMINNHEVKSYSAGIQKGIQLHRKIDEFTDQHPEVLKGVRRLNDKHKRYASVIIDVFYDYILGNSWEQFSDTPLDEFTQNTYLTLQKNLPILPKSLQRSLPHMIADNWLYEYKTLYGIQRALNSMQKRTSRPEWLNGAVNTLQEELPELEKEFKVFFPEIIAFVECECGVIS